MTLFFSIGTDADTSCGLHATLIPTQLDAFVALLRADGQRLAVFSMRSTGAR